MMKLMTTPPVELLFFPVSGTHFAVADPAISGMVNVPVIQPVSGLVHFTPRLPRGTVFWLDNYLVNSAYDSLQTVTIINNPNTGTWRVQLLGTWTPYLAHNASNSALQSALITAAGAVAGDITVVTGINPQSYDVQFANNLGGQDIPTMIADSGTLMNALGQGCSVTVTATQLGRAELIAPTAISIPPLTARIWNGILSTIDQADTPGFQLVANMPEFDILGKVGVPTLIYDVTFEKVTFNGGPQALAPWAFEASTDATPICITDPNLERLEYILPSNTTWAPPKPALTLVGGDDWRTRKAG